MAAHPQGGCHGTSARSSRGRWRRRGSSHRASGARAGAVTRDRPELTQGVDVDVPAAPRLKVVIGRALGTVVVTLHGELSAVTSGMLHDVLLDLIEGQGNLFLVIDMHDVVIPAGARLDGLVAARASLLDRGGRFLLAAPVGPVRGTLEAAGLSEAIEVHPERRHHPSTTAGGRMAEGGAGGRDQR